MTVTLKDPREIWECCVCHAEEIDEWSKSAQKGWRSHFAGLGLEPIILCPPCVDLMAARRLAAKET